MLESLNLVRNELPFKLTDVAMLALGERCQALHTLNIAGSENVTDVGLNWLVEGCTGLLNLNLRYGREA